MSEFLDRISRLSPQRLALLADELNSRLQAAEFARRVPLAVVGIGCRLPGGVYDAESFWTLLHDGVDAISPVPPSRWNVEEFYDPTPDSRGKMDTRWGGFIDGHDEFDPKFFGIAPSEAETMDPQQRLLLETSWEALEHAGIAPASLAGTLTGVYVGICNGDYGQIALNAPRDQITPHLATGLSHAVAAGRISYVLGLQGPSMAVDTSCSASLVAVHLACRSLRMGECNLALAGGVNLVLNPEVTIALSQSRMMAPDGRCKAFSDTANGFVRGEGSGMIVLQRLPDAIRDRRQILAVIRGSACNQDGRSSGLTAPNGPSQEAVIAAALKDAGMKPNDLDYIEAHGTGTALGDPIELGAINSVFSGRPVSAGPLFVGSVKTNVGHLESAAGIAGLIKLVLSIKHGELPPSLHFGAPNPRVEWDRVPIQIPVEARAWRSDEKKRAGGVSSFGFSGTNAHVIVEEFTGNVEANVNDAAAPTDRAEAASAHPLLFPLSAKSESALKTIVSRLAANLAEHRSLSLAGISRTLSSGRSHFEHRIAFVAASHEELIEQLNAFSKNDPRQTTNPSRALAHAPRAAFVFGDADDFGLNFARELYESVPAFHEAMQQCDEILLKELGSTLSSLLYPSASPDVTVAQTPYFWKDPAAFVIQFAFAKLWRHCGIEPSVVYGFGVGEIVAACVAGVISLEDALHLAVAHGSGSSSAYEKCVRSIEYSVPRLVIISNRSDVRIDSPEYWLTALANNAPHPQAIVAVQRENCSAILAIGRSAALKTIEKNVDAEKWLILYDGRSFTSRDFVDTAAELYLRGFSPDLSALYCEIPAITVSLPTYPFERERYWIAGANESKRDRISNSINVESSQPLVTGADSKTDDWLYDLVWEPKPLRREPGLDLDELDDTDSEAPATDELARIARLNSASSPIYASYALQALRECGLDPLSNVSFTEMELAARLKIAPNRRRILGRLLGILAEDGILEKLGDRFRFIDSRPLPAAEAELDRLAMQYPECRTELEILRRCGKKLSAVLQGAYDPMQLVFADGSIDEAEHIYEKSPVCRFFNTETARRIGAAVDRVNRLEKRPARILEIGSGTGATTTSIIKEISGRNFEYCFTDVSPVFLARARKKFSHVSSMTYRLLDVEKDPSAQNFAPGEYDIILAANVLHATANLRHTVAHIRQLMAAGGKLFLIEGVWPDRWLDLTFGLTDGWWHFQDFDLRPSHPLLSAEKWARILSEVGIGSFHTSRYVQADGSPSQQVLMRARIERTANAGRQEYAHQERRKEWVILADKLGIGEAFGKLLTANGEVCELIPQPNEADDISQVLRNLGNRAEHADLEVVYLWAMNAGQKNESPQALQAGVQNSCKLPIHAIQALLKRGKVARLSIVTRGAQATESFSPDFDGAVQSLAWGVGRVLGLEAPEQFGKLMDLDPVEPPLVAANHLFAELLNSDFEDQIAYRDGERQVARLRHVKTNHRNNASSSIRLRRDGSYLLAGGLGGLGLAVGQWAAEQGAGHLVLLGRTGIGASAGQFAASRKEAIQRMEQLGTKVTVVEGDVACDADMKRLFSKFGTELSPLRGVFHTATGFGATELINLTDDAIDTMLRAKVTGTQVLHEHTKAQALDFFVAFSSSTSLLGSRGMAHYAAANQFLDTFAYFRRSNGLPMLSINWGAWDVMRQASSVEQKRLREIGLIPMDSQTALTLMASLPAAPRFQRMIADIDWTVLKPIFEVQRSRPLLQHLGTAEKITPHMQPADVTAASQPAAINLAEAASLSASDRAQSIESFVLQQAAQVLGLRRGELPPADVPLTDLGLDSLMAVDLKNRLQRGVGHELSPTVVFDYPTVSAISGLLDTMLWAARDSFDREASISQKDEIRI